MKPPMQILIIEDEIPAARRLQKMVQEIRPQTNILDVLDSVEGSVRWLKTFPMPDLIFMDIQIADGLSFDIFTQVEIRVPVVFTTAFDQYAVRAFKVSAMDYLLKPIDPDELQSALQKFENQQDKSSNFDISAIKALLQKDTYKERFLVKSGALLTFLSTEDIAFFLSSDGLTQAFTQAGKKYFIEHSLEDLAKMLNPKHFFRVSRGLLIQVTAIKKIHPHLNGRLKLELSPVAPTEVFVSRERVPDFKTWLGA